MPDDGKLLYGQRYDETTDIIASYTQQMVTVANIAAVLGDARTDVTPNDGHSSLVRIWTQPTIADSVFLAFPTTVNLNLPDVLTAVAITYNKTRGSGASKREVGGVIWVGVSGGMNLNPTASATGSGSIIPDADVSISQTWAQNIPAVTYLFYIAGTSISTSDIVTRLRILLTVPATSVVAGLVTTSSAHNLSLNQPFSFLTVVGGSGGITALTTYYVKTIPTSTTFTYSATAGGSGLSGHAATSGTVSPIVSSWPIFKPVSHTLTLKGEQLSLQVGAQAELQYNWGPTNNSTSIMPFAGSDAYTYSRELGNSIRSVRIPPTIHPAITFTGLTSDTIDDITVEAVAEIPAITGSGGAPSFSVLTNSQDDTGEIFGSVTPTSLSATSGQSTIPTAGLYILDSQAEPYKYGTNRVRVTLVNFNAFA